MLVTTNTAKPPSNNAKHKFKGRPTICLSINNTNVVFCRYRLLEVLMVGATTVVRSQYV